MVSKYQAGNAPFSLAAANLNADAFPDLAVVNSSGDNMSVLINAFDAPPPIPPATPIGMPTLAANADPSFPETFDAADELRVITHLQLSFLEINPLGDAAFGPTDAPGGIAAEKTQVAAAIPRFACGCVSAAAHSRMIRPQ